MAAPLRYPSRTAPIWLSAGRLSSPLIIVSAYSASSRHRFNQKSEAEAKGLALAKSVGAEHLADLRRLSVKDMQKPAWLPRTYVDGYLLHADLTRRTWRGDSIPVR